jgi:hypothetical protein
VPELLDPDRKLHPGDVLMCNLRLKDKRTGKPFEWKFFMVVTDHDWLDDEVTGRVIGAEKHKEKEMTLRLNSPRTTIHYLAPDEWPDGVHAFRMSMILRGVIEIV